MARSKKPDHLIEHLMGLQLSDVKFPIRLVLSPIIAPGVHIDITDIVDPEADLGRLARWAESNKTVLSLRTTKKD